jgi:RNA polymerase sigma factor (sigma-70 family)
VPDDNSDSHETRKSALGLLRRLKSADAGSAWVEFVDLYAPLIMHAACQFEYEQERINDCFLFACEQLSDNGFRRLLKFNAASKVKFNTWLGTVVFNLCVDWHRREYGRVRLLPGISALPAFDQSVYRLVIEQGMNKEASFQALRADFPELTRELVANAVARIHSLLTPRQRWQITVRNRGRKQVRGGSMQDWLEKLPETADGPEAELQKQQELESLQAGISRLPADQRLLLRLRFKEGLGLKKIAQLKFHGDVNMAWRQIQTAIDALFQQIHKKSFIKNQKN